MLGRLRNSYAEIDLGALERNFLNLKGLLKNCSMVPMIKADAYGHGDVQVARVCERLGARFLGVALVEEGIRLRLAGVQTPILVFCQFDSMGAEAIVKYRLTPVLSVLDQIKKLKSVLHETASYPVHVKFNTGMQRLGFEPEEASRVATEFQKEAYLKLEGVCTHFAAAEDDGDMTKDQLKIFNQVMSDIRKINQNSMLFHYLNSAGLLSGLQPQLDLARPGISLYGALPKLKKDSPVLLQPVMSVKSFIGFIHRVRKGARVSYGGTFQASKDSVIAVVPMGYADGLPRVLSNKGTVLVRGTSCPIVGIVCMDYFMIDVTELADQNHGPLVGDEVVIIGQQNDKIILADHLAKIANTVSYEILTGMQARLPRIYIH